VIYGIAAALGWGLADVFAALAGRRAGSIRTTLLSQIASVLALTLFLPAGRGHWGISAVDLGLVLAVGCVGAVGYLAIYAALTAGPLALVSPIVSAYSVVVIALSLIILHEHLGAVALTGASVIIVGVALASTDLRAVRDPNALRGPGVKLALVAMVAFGVAAFGLGRYGQRFGWFLAAYVARIGTLAVVGGAFAVAVRDRSPGRSDRWLPMAVAAGVLDIGATVSFVYGSQVGLVSLVAAASAAYPLVPVVFGMWTFGERITRAQLVGVATVAVGLVVLAFR
jgi:drug/metabolite transporter (DMT)-like permease